MAQRSARARVKLDQISTYPPPPVLPRTHKGIAKIGSGGLLTPSVSSASGSSRNSLNSLPKLGKSSLRSFLDTHSERLRGRLGGGCGGGGGVCKPENDNGHAGYSSYGSSVEGLALGIGLGFGGGLLGDEKVVVKRWEGGGRRGELWDGGGRGKKDLELWFPDGDTLIYLTDRPTPPRNPQGLYKPPAPQPSFRLSSSTIRNTESPFLIAALEDSFRERPPTPPGNGSNNPDMDFSPSMGSLRSMSGVDFENQFSQQNTRFVQRRVHNEEDGIQYRLYFPAQMGCDKTTCLRHHLTTRNFFAILFNRSLVGITLGQTLLDLVERTELYLSSPSPLNYDLIVDRGMSEIESPYGTLLHNSPSSNNGYPQAPKVSSAVTQKLIMDYLLNRDFDDVRNWPEGAAGLVVWAERAGATNGLGYNLSCNEMGLVGIEELWREGFVHCTGMLARLEGGGEWRVISPITKALIDRASLEIQVRVATTDQRLSAFGFGDMWPQMSAGSPQARIAFEKLQKFLIKHYQGRFGSWPPQSSEGRFSRMLYVQLQRDFSALYDYLVDREVCWSSAAATGAARSTEKKKIIKPSAVHWRADDEDLPITDILLAFDAKNNYPSIPHPFCLVPQCAAKSPIKSRTPGITGGRFFSGATKRGSMGSFPVTNPLSDKAAALALSEATNIESLLSSSVSNSLVDAFARHEKSLNPSEIDPHDARKGRWILIYGILQTLATVAVDAPGIKYTDGVDYFLCAKLRGTPPWKASMDIEAGLMASGGQERGDERSHFRSHCWTVPRTWNGPSQQYNFHQKHQHQQSWSSNSFSSNSTINFKHPRPVNNRYSAPPVAVSIIIPQEPTVRTSFTSSNAATGGSICSGDDGDDEMGDCSSCSASPISEWKGERTEDETGRWGEPWSSGGDVRMGIV